MPGLGQLKQEIATQVSHRRLGFWLALLFAAFLFGLLPFTFRMMHSYDDAVMVDARIIAVDRDPASGETRMTSEFIDLTGKAHRATESAAYHYAPGEPEVGQKIAYFYRPDAAGDIYGTPRADGLLKWLFGGAGALLALIASALAIAAIAQWTDIDLWLADLYYDPVRRVFPWDNTWFARDFMHGYLKQVIVWFGFLTIAAMLIDLVYPLFRKSPLRRLQWRFVALASILEPLLVRNLKASSNLHCPVGIDLYGGRAPLLRLFDAVPPEWHAGHCFPAGHASSAMWLSALAAFWLPHAPARARAVFAFGLLAGFTLGWVQQMRGQHFLSHTLWTAWLSSALIVALFALFARPLGLASSSPIAARPKLVEARP